MKLYKISQTVNDGYDTYDSSVVCAENEEMARRTHPNGDKDYGIYYNEEKKAFYYKFKDWKEEELYENKFGSWTNDLSAIKVEYLGEAVETLNAGVILSSFHAG